MVSNTLVTASFFVMAVLYRSRDWEYLRMIYCRETQMKVASTELITFVITFFFPYIAREKDYYYKLRVK